MEQLETVNSSSQFKAATLSLTKQFVQRSVLHYQSKRSDNLATEELSNIMMYGYVAFLALGQVKPAVAF